MNKEKFQHTDVLHFVRYGKIDPKSLNPSEWLELIEDSLASCGIILREVAEKRGNSMTMKAILNHPIDGCPGESRITSKEVMDTLPKSLIHTSSWIFIPIKILETREEKGQFFERRLFLLADLAKLMIVDTTFRKDPQPDQKLLLGTVPKINENVVGCQVYMDKNLELTAEGLADLIMPYLADLEMELGKQIIMRTLDPVVAELRKMESTLNKTKKEMQQFLEIRKRLGFID